MSRGKGKGRRQVFEDWSLMFEVYKEPYKESACKAEDLGSIPGLKGMATHSSTLAGEFYGLQSPWGHKESDMAE